MKIIFRCLLIGIVLYEVADVILFQDTSPRIAREDLANLSVAGLLQYDRMYKLLLYLGSAAAILQLVSLIGLWFFWRPAPELFVVSFVFLWIDTEQPSFGLVGYWWTLPWWLSFLLINLAVIALSYIGPLRKYFHKEGVGEVLTKAGKL